MHTVQRRNIPATLTDFEIPSVIIMNPETTHLSIRGCKKITDISIPLILSLKHLKEVNVSGSGISIEGLAVLCKNQNINVVFLDRAITLPCSSPSNKRW